MQSRHYNNSIIIVVTLLFLLIENVSAKLLSKYVSNKVQNRKKATNIEKISHLFFFGITW